MLSPSASKMNAPALAKKSMCELLWSTSGTSGNNRSGASRRERRTAGFTLNFLRHSFAKQARRSENQDQDEDREDHDVGPLRALRNVLRRERLDQADQEAAEHRARDVTDAAEYRGRKSLEAGFEAVEEPGRAVVNAADEAGRARQRAADQERHRDRGVNVDAHQLRGVAV